jgi:hypothetical protein
VRKHLQLVPNLNEVMPQSPTVAPSAALPWENATESSTSTWLWQNWNFPSTSPVGKSRFNYLRRFALAVNNSRTNSAFDMRWFSWMSFLLVAVFTSGCGSQHKIVGDYRLEQFEDFKTYYLHKRGLDDSSQGGSIIGGSVIRLGWNSRCIVAERHSIYRGDADGWMIIDVQSGAISGPLSETDFQARAEIQGIQIYKASEAWKKL